jgi:hypothetical protein
MRFTSEHLEEEGLPRAAGGAGSTPAPVPAEQPGTRESPEAAEVAIRKGIEWLFEKLKGGPR